MTEQDPDVVRLDAGEVVFKEGDPGADVYMIVSGQVQIAKRIGGTERALATLGPGRYFGEMALFEGAPRSASATVLKRCQLLKFTKDDLLERTAKDPSFTFVLLQDLCSRLRFANAVIEELLQGEAMLEDDITDMLTRVSALLHSSQRSAQE